MADEKPPSYSNVEQGPVDDKGDTALAQVSKHAGDADEAMKAFEGHDGELLILDDATNKRLLRKIDLNILPVRMAHSERKAVVLMLIANVCCLRSQLP